MEKSLTFIDCFKRALALYAIPWKAPEIQRFIDKRCKELKIPNPATGRQTVYNWMAGKPPSVDGYLALSKILNISTRWLIEGTGDMRRSMKATPEQAEVLDILESLGKANPDARDNWVSQGRKLLELVTPKGTNNPYRR